MVDDVDFYRPVVIARDNTILAGHGLVLAAKQMGRRRVPVKRLDVDPNEPRALRVLVGDNELGHFAERDDRMLTDTLNEVKGQGGLSGTGFDEMQLANLIHVTRPRSEIPDFDAAKEAVGIDYEREPPPLRLIITFETADDHRRPRPARCRGETRGSDAE